MCCGEVVGFDEPLGERIKSSGWNRNTTSAAPPRSKVEESFFLQASFATFALIFASLRKPFLRV